MRVLMAHTRYQIRGGEDECFEAEVQLLREMGVEVVLFEDDNHRIPEMGKLAVARSTVWSKKAYDGIRAKLRAHPADIVHVHNYLPLISPAAYHAAKAEGAAVVQTLHNYRLMCPNSYFYRNGNVCEDCLGKSVAWPSILHRCYRNSTAGSATIAAMLAYHRMIGTYRNKVDLYFALNEFMRQKHIEGGIPAERIVIKPNFVRGDPGMGSGDGDYALFIARLTPEKGVDVLLDAWRRIGERLRLKIVGDGPLTDHVRDALSDLKGVDFLGRQPLEACYKLFSRAQCFISASTWYEGFPRTFIEAFAHGVPVIAPALGPMADGIDDGHTGLHFRPGDSASLVEAVERFLDVNDQRETMREAARATYLEKFTADANKRMTIEAYQQAIDVSRKAA